MVPFLMYIAGCLWLGWGLLLAYSFISVPGATREFEMRPLVICLMLSFGVLFVGIGGLIQALRKRAM